MTGDDYFLCYAVLQDVHLFTISKRNYKQENTTSQLCCELTLQNCHFMKLETF